MHSPRSLVNTKPNRQPPSIKMAVAIPDMAVSVTPRSTKSSEILVEKAK